MKIDYRIRPAKSVERKMLCEAWGKLGAFRALSGYRYVGFGSAFFTDFMLVHRVLGIHDMVSIEKNAQHSERFEFNKPFRCIQMEFGTATERLPFIDLKNKPAIVWLDYEVMLNEVILNDIQTVVGRLVSGSSLVVCVNADILTSCLL
jgi:hypothetical protein